ncbi:MAG TPA: Wzz/FepE/Etk N-terminal domain-containing protein [Candidatus Angelobacter sp.]|nr:Wzz/FepE/Etk N-terminal domain-containing protein [Candidatus Angelobacter sp.]
MAQLDDAKFELRVAEAPSLPASADPAAPLEFPEPLIVLAKRKAFILKLTVAAAVLSILGSLLLPTTYTANAKIMPPQQNQSMSTTALLSQLGPLAVLAGQGLGLRNPGDIYVAMLHSDTVANGLIDRFSLMSVYRVKTRVDARRALQDRTEIVASKDGVISISVDDRRSYWFGSSASVEQSRERAAALANGYVEELDKLTKTLAVTEAGKRRAFFERETKLASEDLANAEQALKQTQERTGLILLDPQSKAMIEGLASLRGRIAAQEILVRSMRSFATKDNPDLKLAEDQLAAMKAQLNQLERGQGRSSLTDLPIESVPTAGLEYIRKLREVKYRETLFELLAKQYEAAKIDEARDALIVQELDKATAPERKSAPHRGLIVISVTIAGFLVAILASFFIEAWGQAREDARFVARLQLFRFYLRGREKSQV